MTAAALGVLGSCGTELRAAPSSVIECGAPVIDSPRYRRSTSRSRCCSPTWCTRWTSPRPSGRSGCARSWPNWSTRARGGAALRRHGGQVHRRRDHGGVRRAGGVGGPRRSCLSGGLGRSRRGRSDLPSTSDDRDGVDLRLRVGLNSGQVIAGEIGSGPFGYTAIGEQVGMAQRMESVAPPGGVMLSASTARLVDGAAALGEPELVQIKGADEPVTPIGCWAWAKSIALSAVLSRIWSVGGGRCPPLRACWTAQSTDTARWSGWWAHRASVRAVWCARSPRWQPVRGGGVHRLL